MTSNAKADSFVHIKYVNKRCLSRPSFSFLNRIGLPEKENHFSIVLWKSIIFFLIKIQERIFFNEEQVSVTDERFVLYVYIFS